MQKLIAQFLGLCAFRIGPQNLPASDAVLSGALGVYVLVGILLSLPGYRFDTSVLQTAVDTVLLAGFSYAALTIGQRTERYTQTLTALAGAGAIIGLAALPFIYLLQDVLRAVARGGEPDSPWLILYAALVIWVLAVNAHIFRHALGRSFGFGLLLSLGYAILTSMVIQSLFPPPGAA